MFDKLSFIEERFNELEIKISDPEIIADQDLWRKLCKEHSDISPIVEKFKEYKSLENAINEAKELLDSDIDKDFRELAEMDLAESKEKIETVKE